MIRISNRGLMCEIKGMRALYLFSELFGELER